MGVVRLSETLWLGSYGRSKLEDDQCKMTDCLL